METLDLRPGRASAGAGAAPQYQTPELVSLVREARLHACETRQEAGKILVTVLGTTGSVARTRRQTVRALHWRRQAMRSSAAAREPVTRPGVAVAAGTHDAPAVPAVPERPGISPAVLRRAVAFIDEHADQDITVADIAATSFVSVRAVQLAFRGYMGTTPSEYLRKVRLERAHRDLSAADPARDSVTAVAYRWGFASASRFASYYRSAYGVTPSRTLRGRPISAGASSKHVLAAGSGVV
jgi:AraC-like DNA-binding protein